MSTTWAKALRLLIPRAVTLTLCLSVWEWFASGAASALVPPPSAVLAALVEMYLSGELVSDVRASLYRVTVGYSIGATLGIGLGLFSGRSWIGDATVTPVVQILRPVPVVAMVWFAITWLGLGEASKLFLVAWGTFFPVWINAYLGVRQVKPELTWAAASLGASRARMLLHVILPASASQCIAGLRTAIGTAFICLVAAEMAGAVWGLGFRVDVSYLVFRLDRMAASLVVLGVLGATCDLLFAAAVDVAAPWYRSRRGQAE